MAEPSERHLRALLNGLSARLRAADAATADDVLLTLCRAFAGHNDVRHWLFELGGDPRTSIDAVLALVRSVLPGCQISIWLDTQGAARVSVWEVDGDLAAYRESASTLPLALCLALVEWRIAHG